MLIELKVPVLAESVADATLMTWRRKPGDVLQRGDSLVDLETDKVTLEVVAPEAGVLVEIRKDSGATVLSQEVLAIIDANGAGSASPAEIAPAPAPAAAGPVTGMAATPKQSPAVRKLVEEHALDPATLAATGPGGRLTKADVLEHVGAMSAPAALPALPPRTPESEVATTRVDERVPMTRLRQRAAERLLAAQHGSALLTTFNEIDMKPAMELRERHGERFEQKHGVRLGYMSLFARATVEALKRHPILNASVDGNDIIYHRYYDLGIAVSSPRGLVVPVLRDVNLLSFADIELRIRDFGLRAKDATLTVDDLSGGTFTITNGGVFGSLLSTPIVNPPQSAILGMHKIEERAVVERGQVVVRPMMYVALSYDHRIIDGRDAVQFLVAVKEQLEDPARMLLGV